MWRTDGGESNVRTQRRDDITGCLCAGLFGCVDIMFSSRYSKEKIILLVHLTTLEPLQNDSFSKHWPTPLDMHHCLSEIPTVKTFLIEYHYYKRSLCVRMSVFFVFYVQMSLLSSQGCGAFFSHKIILMVFGTFKIKRI